MPPDAAMRFEVTLTTDSAEAYQQATHRRLRSADQGLSIFFVSSFLAAPAVKAQLARLCPPGRFPVHSRQLSRRLRALTPGHTYGVEVGYLPLDGRTPGVRLAYRVLDGAEAVASGEVEIHFLEQSTLLELVR